ncbi:hypothetical protein ACTJJ4_11015 [Microbacterium sp. 22195]|uniref:hypothetical protein n=1 Tax=Microbacterium sp. 22195 TaxID=3453891 RepID=UPI003F85C6AF
MSVETPDFVAMVKRMLRAAGRRVAAGDEWELAELVSLRGDLEDAIQAAVDGLREQGHSWAYIADGLGISRQSAHERYGRKAAA